MFVTSSWIFLGLLASATAQTEPLKTCNVTEDIQGECILLQLCPRAIELLKINDFRSLRKLTCGYDKLDAKVCCVTKKTDGALVYQNATHEAAATSRPDTSTQLPKATVKLPPDPATLPPLVPTEPPSTRVVYSTTFRVSSLQIEKQTKESPLPPLPRRPPPPVTTSTTETTTFDNPLGVDIDFQVPDTDAAYEQSEIAPALPANSVNFQLQTNSRPSVPYPAYILPSRNECGLLDTSDRIYGGQLAGLDELPWLVRIKYLIQSREMYSCHGSLISNRFIVTAAHCVANLKIIEVRLGEWDADTDIDCVNGDCNDPPVDVKIDRTYIHPTYSKATLLGDIALLRLETPVNFTEFIRPVCLPDTDYIARLDYTLDEDFYTGGWGRTEYEIRSVIKRKVKLSAVPMTTCRVALKRISNELAGSTICAGGRKGEDSCAGDSGSSLVKIARENYQPNWFIFGVTSFGPKRCGSEGIPGIYTRITYYMGWILNTIATSS